MNRGYHLNLHEPKEFERIENFSNHEYITVQTRRIRARHTNDDTMCKQHGEMASMMTKIQISNLSVGISILLARIIFVIKSANQRRNQRSQALFRYRKNHCRIQKHAKAQQPPVLPNKRREQNRNDKIQSCFHAGGESNARSILR